MSTGRKDADKPNVLFIAIDDLNEWIGCLGVNPDVKTPNMDRLARQGMLFTNACCASPVCNPSRTAILTGARPSTTGCYMLNDKLEDSPVRERVMPFPLHFRHEGYQTMTVGKVDHGSCIERATQAAFGESMWDEIGEFGGQQFDLRSRHAQCMTEAPSVYRFASHWGPLDDDQAETLSDLQTARWASEQLARDFDRPFVLAAGFFRPHVPLIAPKRFFDMYDKEKLWLPPTGPDDMEGMPSAARQVALTGYQDYLNGTHRQVVEAGVWRDIVQAYLACVSFTDSCIGQVLTALERSRYAQNTIVVLWSDNGWGLGEHFHWKKWSVFDSGARVPLIIKAPGVTKGEQVCTQGVELTDLYPTLVDLCGLRAPEHLDGQSLGGLLSGEQTERERPALTSFGPHNHSLRTSRRRYTRYCDGSEELYDYETDPWEHENLAGRPECEKVKRSLARWLPTECAPALASSPPAGGPFELEAGQQVSFRSLENGFAGERIRIGAEVKAEGDDGVIVHHSGYFASYALYVKQRRLCMAVNDVSRPLRWDRLERTETIVQAQTPLPDSLVMVEGMLETDGTITLKVDGVTVGTGKADGPLSIYPSGVLDAGRFVRNNYPTVGDCERSEQFPGIVRDIRVSFGER